jgi:drug/metabolite transporter (DMT)-like permease
LGTGREKEDQGSKTFKSSMSEFVNFSKAASSISEHYDMMKGLISGFMAATSSGIMLCLIKILLFHTEMSSFELIYLRSLMTCLCVGVILHSSGNSPFNVDRDIALFVFIRVIGSCFGFMFEIFALDFISVSKIVLIINNPFLTSVISFLLIGEISSRHDLLSFLVCTIGVILLTDPFSSS